MTPEQTSVVQNSFRKVIPIGDAFAQMFYTRLFELNPSLKGLFLSDLEKQGQKLMVAMAIVVLGLNDLKRILPQVQELGRRHAGYGADPRHYETVSTALLWTLERCLGEEFTDEARQAWTDTCELLSSTMIAASTKRAARGHVRFHTALWRKRRPRADRGRCLMPKMRRPKISVETRRCQNRARLCCGSGDDDKFIILRLRIDGAE